MSIARRFTERAATAWVSLMATGLVTAGVMLAGLGATLRQTAVDITNINVITSGLMVMGAALAVTGAISGIANWMVSAHAEDPADISGAQLKGLVGAAAALPVILALQLTSLIDYWRDLVRLADQYDLLTTANGPAALVFAPAVGVLLVPGIEAVGALTVATYSGAVVLLTLTRSARVLKLTAIGTVLVGGLCAGSWVGVVATERLVPSVQTIIRTSDNANGQEQARLLDLVERHRIVCMRSARTLSWGWLGVLFIAVRTRAVVRPRTGPIDITDASPLNTSGMDERTRERTLLDAADRLYRKTSPRRF